MGMQFCNSSSSRSGKSGPFNVRGGWGGGALEAGRFPSGLFPMLYIHNIMKGICKR